jgi:hypothetical protein
MINHECTRIDTNFLNDEIQMSNVEGMTKVETFVGFLTRPLPLGLASGLPVYVAVPASSILRIPKAFGTGTDALQFVHSDWFRYSSFVLRHSFHAPSLRIEIRDVSTSLDMTSEKRSVSSV